MRQGRGEGGGRSGEVARRGPEDADDGAGERGGEGVGEEVSASDAKELERAAGACGAEDGQAGCAFGEVKRKRGEGELGCEQEAYDEDREVRQRERHGREGQRHDDVRADGDEEAGGDDDGDLAGGCVRERTKGACGGGGIDGFGVDGVREWHKCSFQPGRWRQGCFVTSAAGDRIGFGDGLFSFGRG